ncbi:MAG TPA: hypothetical protein VFH47_08660, partial [Candidatus Thermoplasmatota archaeon]|nr:hypothetical protein [Candidatus Thermoplasmatota archaeon]
LQYRGAAGSIMAIKALLLGSLFAAALLAGCADSGDDNDQRLNTANLAYEGERSGTHRSTINCDRDGQLNGGGTIDEGGVTVKVMDGAGNTVYAKSFNDAVEVETEGVSGQPGEWTVEATREGQRFDGAYDFALAC